MGIRTSAKHSDDSKRRIVAAYMDGSNTQLELCRLHGISSATLKRWMRAFGEQKKGKAA